MEINWTEHNFKQFKIANQEAQTNQECLIYSYLTKGFHSVPWLLFNGQRAEMVLLAIYE